MQVLALFLQQKDFVMKALLILFRIATFNPTYFQRVAAILLSSNLSSDKNNSSSPHQLQLTTQQRIAIFEIKFKVQYFGGKSDDLGTQRSDDEYFQSAKQHIEDGKITFFGIFRILDVVNLSTVQLLIQSLKLADPSKSPTWIYSPGEAFQYILHVKSQQWKELDLESKQELLDTLEDLRSRHPDSKRWRIENDFNLINQAIIKLSTIIDEQK